MKSDENPWNYGGCLKEKPAMTISRKKQSIFLIVDQFDGYWIWIVITIYYIIYIYHFFNEAAYHQ